jgi:YbbR domain-containing protein
MKSRLLDNLGLKISAVLLAIFLWLFVTSRGLSELSFEIPIEFKNIPVGYGIASNINKTVQVTIRGQELMIKNIKSSDIRVMVNLSKAKEGEATYYITKEDIKLPYAAKVMNIQPSSLKLRLDEMVTKAVKIKPAVCRLGDLDLI